MYKKIFGAALIVAVSASCASPAIAQEDAAKVQKKKEVIHSCLLQIYLAEKKRPQALAEYAIIVGMNPSDAKMRFNYGCYIAQGNTPADWNSALVQLKKAVELDPANPDYHGTIGTVYVKLKNNAEAFKWLKNAMQYGGAPKYKKLYEDVFKLMEWQKRTDEVKKRNEEIKKQQQLQKKQGGTTPGKSIDDDDDDW